MTSWDIILSLKSDKETLEEKVIELEKKNGDLVALLINIVDELDISDQELFNKIVEKIGEK